MEAGDNAPTVFIRLDKPHWGLPRTTMKSGYCLNAMMCRRVLRRSEASTSSQRALSRGRRRRPLPPAPCTPYGTSTPLRLKNGPVQPRQRLTCPQRSTARSRWQQGAT
jgi:hypothetical protein